MNNVHDLYHFIGRIGVVVCVRVSAFVYVCESAQTHYNGHIVGERVKEMDG